MKQIYLSASVLLFSIFLTSCNQAIADGSPAVKSYEECVKLGFPVMRSMPPRCVVPGGKIFTQGVTLDHVPVVPKVADAPGIPIAPAAPSGGGFCKNLCGDGTCQEIVCMAEGCPCPESKGTCPTDCS